LRKTDRGRREETPTTRYSRAEELANSITHGLGAVLAAAGLAVLVVLSVLRGTAVHVASSAVFGVSMLAMYAASTAYHAARDPTAKKVLRKIDHAAILLLIAGTYTPFTLVTLRGPWGWSIFAAVWGLAGIGLLFEDALRRRWIGLSIGLYVLMGWVAAAAIKPLLEALPARGFALLLSGGLAYTCGTVFYLAGRIPFNHAWWHVAVLAGSILHFFAVLLYVIPRG
jgi:hemolysin III